MLKKMGWRGAMIVLIIIGFFVYVHFYGQNHHKPLTFTSTKAHPLDHELHLRPMDVVPIFEKNKLNLTLVQNRSTKYDINGLHPQIYEINNNKTQFLFIYEFKNLAERKRFFNQNAFFSSLDPFNEVKNKRSGSYTIKHYYVPFYSWNLLFIEKFPPPKTLKDSNSLPDVSSIVYKDLNDGHTLTFSGKSVNWKATFTLKYYQHWYKNKNGYVLKDSASKGFTFNIDYTGKTFPLENVKISYKLPVIGEGGSTTYPTLKTRHVTLWNSNNKQEFVQPTYPTLTFQWGQHQKSITLKETNSTSKK